MSERDRENYKIKIKKTKTASTWKTDELWHGGMLHMLFFPSKHTNFTQFQTMNYK